MGTLHHKYRGYLGGAQGSVFQKMCNIIFSSKKYNFIMFYPLLKIKNRPLLVGDARLLKHGYLM